MPLITKEQRVLREQMEAQAMSNRELGDAVLVAQATIQSIPAWCVWRRERWEVRLSVLEWERTLRVDRLFYATLEEG